MQCCHHRPSYHLDTDIGCARSCYWQRSNHRHPYRSRRSALQFVATVSQIILSIFMYMSIGVGDGGPAGSPPPPKKKKKIGKIFFGQFLCKILAFSSKNHVKLGNFVNFSGMIHAKFWQFVNFSYIFFGQKCRAPLKLLCAIQITTKLLIYLFAYLLTYLLRMWLAGVKFSHGNKCWKMPTCAYQVGIS